MKKKLLIEKDILEAVKQGKKSVVADKNTIVTPAAHDAIHRYKLSLLSSPIEQQKNTTSTTVQPSSVGKGVIAIGSDHGGFSTKEILKKYLAELGYSTIDVGTNSEEACDYPDFAYAVSRLVAKGEAWRGIMIEATGVASTIVCNKVPGIRATACYNEFVAQSAREHNDANVLTLGAKALGEATIKSIAKVWLETSFGGGRHQKRVDKILDVEKKFSK